MAISKVGNKVKYLAGSPPARLRKHATSGSGSGSTKMSNLTSQSQGTSGYETKSDYAGASGIRGEDIPQKKKPAKGKDKPLVAPPPPPLKKA